MDEKDIRAQAAQPETDVPQTADDVAEAAPTALCNPGKNAVIEVDGQAYLRLGIRTPLITKEDDMADVVRQWAMPLLTAGDILFISEKAVACTQGRAIPLEDIHPRPLAKLLSRFVLRTPYGIGLAMPETMECALRECGTVRILFAAFVSAIGKLLGKRGWFYIIAGEQARGIDGPCEETIPPYNRHVVLGPLHPEKVAAELSGVTGTGVAIVDINDLGGNILGQAGCDLTAEQLCRILKDNPLGQENQSTPMGIIRKTQAEA